MINPAILEKAVKDWEAKVTEYGKDFSAKKEAAAAAKKTAAEKDMAAKNAATKLRVAKHNLQIAKKRVEDNKKPLPMPTPVIKPVPKPKPKPPKPKK